jgi:two-component system LytT family sensor kinase
MEYDCITGFSLLICGMARFLFRFRWHILFWIGYFIFWTWFSASYYHNPVWIAFVLTTAWSLGQGGSIYLTTYRWIPRLLKPRRTWLFLGALILTILCCAAFASLSCGLFLKWALPSYPVSLFAFFGYMVMGNTNIVLVVIGLTVLRDRVRNERRSQMLEKEHAENELRFLKSQMNPHFLFNAINSIYVLIRKDPGLAEHTLARFSDMLRYQLYDCSTDFIRVEKEITYLENYIRLEQLRKGPMLTIDYQSDESVSGFSIAPLLIMPLIENAFKFVSSHTDRENIVRLRLFSSGDSFHFTIFNTVDDPGPANPDLITNPLLPGNPHLPRGGIGLENIRRRLELLYPNKHQLNIDSGKDYYSVSLKLQIK